MTPVYRPIRAVTPYGNAPASRLVSTGMGAWRVQLPGTVPPWLPQGSTMAYGGLGRLSVHGQNFGLDNYGRIIAFGRRYPSEALGRLGIAPSAMTARRPYYGAPYGAFSASMIAQIADAAARTHEAIVEFQGNIIGAQGQKLDAAMAAQQQKLSYLQLQQLTGASASAERTTLLLVGGGLAAVAALGVFLSSRRQNGRRRNSRNRGGRR